MTSQSGGGGVPSGVAGGVLGGTYPSPSFSTNGTTPLLGTLLNQLGADVAMTNSGQFYDGPLIALTIGTWLVGASLCLVNGGASPVTYFVKVWDGATAYISGEDTRPSGGYVAQLSLPPIPIVLAAPATLKASVLANLAGSTLKSALTANGAGNNASYIVAQRIA